VSHIETQAVHAGDRKKLGDYIPVTTPIFGATTFYYEKLGQLERVFAREVEGQGYTRYGNPTAAAFEEQVAALEGGDIAVSTASGMAALELALMIALTDRRRKVVAADVLFGQTYLLLQHVFEPAGVEARFVDPCNLAAFEALVAEEKPGCVLIEAVSNPLLRVPQVDRIAEIAHAHGALLIVDSTFTTPALLRPLELGADIVFHSATKYLAGHADVLGGVTVAREEHRELLTALVRTLGPNLGPFECYLAMRGVKTLPLRMRRQCDNARLVAEALGADKRVEHVHYPGLISHPDRETVRRIFVDGRAGAMVSFEIRDAGREEVFRYINALEMVLRTLSLGDVHSLVSYPTISSHRNLSPKHRARLGIGDNLLRLSVGIEAADDIIGDLLQALDAV